MAGCSVKAQGQLYLYLNVTNLVVTYMSIIHLLILFHALHFAFKTYERFLCVSHHAVIGTDPQTLWAEHDLRVRKWNTSKLFVFIVL